ncbi:MAG: DUF1579 family protein [Planctomycetota bacterium]
MTSLPVQCERLSRLVGAYRGLESSADGKELYGTYKNELVLEGFFLSLTYSQSLEATIQYQMRAVIGFEFQQERFFMNWYDSMGGYGTGIYGFFEGDLLQLEGPDSANGGYSRFTWEVEANAQLITLESSEDREHWSVLLAARYERQ